MKKVFKVTSIYDDGEQENFVNAKNGSEARLIWGFNFNDSDRKLIKLIVDEVNVIS